MTVIPDVLDPAWSAEPPSTAVVVTETSAPYAEYVADQVAQVDDEAAFMARVIHSRLEAAEFVDPIEQARRDLNRGKTLLAIPDVRDQDREREQRKATIEQWRRDVLSGRVDPWERRK